MEEFSFSTRLFFGEGALERLRRVQDKKVMIVTDRFMAGIGVPDKVAGHLTRCQVSVFDGVVPDPPIEVVAAGVQALQDCGAEVMIAVGGGTAVGINALLSRSLGEKRQDMADRAANTGIFLALCSFAVFALIGLFLSRPFFLAQTKNEVIVEYGTQYATVCLGLSIGIFSQFCFERLLQSTGRTFYAMCTQLTGAVINIVLDPILIFGYFGAPRLEVVGAAVATVAGQLVAAIIAVIINIKRNPDIHIRLREIRWNRVVAGEIYRVGLPSIVMQSISSIMTFGVNKILISFTEAATAVFGAYFKLQSFVFMPVFGLNNGTVPIIAYNYGAGKPDRIMGTIKLAAVYATTIMLCGFAVFQLMPDKLLMIFSASDTMLSIGIPALRTISLSFLFAGFSIVCSSMFQALGHGMLSLWISVFRQLVVLLPVAFVFAKLGGLHVVWFAFPIAEVFAIIFSAVCLGYVYRKEILPLKARQEK